MDRELRTTPPFRTIRPRALADVVLTCEHRSSRLPGSIRPTAAERGVLRSHWGFDPGAWAVTRVVSRELDAPAIGGTWSRLLVDLNRAVDDETFARAVAGGLRVSWNSRLAPEARARRAAWVHAVYHAALDRLLAERVALGMRPLLFAIHSFTPELDGARRPFDVGILFDEDETLAVELAVALRASGLDVRYNEPYSGRAGMMYAVERHARHYRLPCLELELNQGLLGRRGAGERLGLLVARGLSRITTRAATSPRHGGRSRPRS
jgi:predicted N-formylglutamate amidohydrolase